MIYIARLGVSVFGRACCTSNRSLAVKVLARVTTADFPAFFLHLGEWACCMNLPVFKAALLGVTAALPGDDPVAVAGSGALRLVGVDA